MMCPYQDNQSNTEDQAYSAVDHNGDGEADSFGRRLNTHGYLQDAQCSGSPDRVPRPVDHDGILNGTESSIGKGEMNEYQETGRACQICIDD